MGQRARMTRVPLLDELEAIRQAQDAVRFAPVPPPPDGFNELVAGYWADLNAELIAVEVERHATDEAERRAIVDAETMADRLEARTQRRRQRVLGIVAVVDRDA